MARPKKTTTRISIGAAVLPWINEQLNRIAETEGRTKSNITEYMLARGIAAYLRDGNLDEPTQTIDGKKSPPNIPATEAIPTEKIPHAISPGQTFTPKLKKGGRK